MNEEEKRTILEKINKREPRNKSLTIKLKESEFLKIKKFCINNNIKVSDLIYVKIKEILEEIV